MMVNIKQEVKSAFTENIWAVFASVLILFLSLILGYVFEPYLYSYLNPAVDDLASKVQSGVITLTFHDIFLNNIMVVFRMFILGIFFCFSALILAFNGFFVGYYVATQENILSTLLFIIPHGIFEFSSCIVACASGFVLFNFIFNFVLYFKNQNGVKFSDRLMDAAERNYDKLKQALVLLAVAAVLMAIAGVVETYVTLPLGYFLISVFGI